MELLECNGCGKMTSEDDFSDCMEMYICNDCEDGTFEYECEMRDEALDLENQKHIFLYADEFTSDVWSGYCAILGLPIETTEIKINVASAEAMGV